MVAKELLNHKDAGHHLRLSNYPTPSITGSKKLKETHGGLVNSKEMKLPPKSTSAVFLFPRVLEY